MTLRVFLLDDHEVVRRGLHELIESADDLTMVGWAETASEALEKLPGVRPDVAILDVRLPDGSGIEVCREIRSQHPEIQCLMLTSYADDEALFSSIMAGASGFVLKQIRGSDLIDAVRRVGRGESLLDPTVTQRVLERLREPRTRAMPTSSASPTRRGASSTTSARARPTARSPGRCSSPRRP